MKFSTSRENLLTPLQQIVGVIERRHTLPILANVLLKLDPGHLELTGTDLEVQLVTRIPIESEDQGRITVPARKLLDICRLLPDKCDLTLDYREERFHLKSGRSRFALSTLPGENYPEFDTGAADLRLTLPSRILRRAMEKTLFAMAQQDVRYYLNGLLFEIDAGTLRTVASDGHRLALFEDEIALEMEQAQAIIPRKGALELFRLLADDDSELTIELASNSIRVGMNEWRFSSKLIEGRFPDYRRVMPSHTSRQVVSDKATVKSALTRVSVLSTEKFRGASVEIEPGILRLKTQNPEHEEAEEEIPIEFEGEPFGVGFNAAYLLDAVNNIESDEVSLSFADSNGSCLVEDRNDQRFRFIVMPMRI